MLSLRLAPVLWGYLGSTNHKWYGPLATCCAKFFERVWCVVWSRAMSHYICTHAFLSFNKISQRWSLLHEQLIFVGLKIYPNLPHFFIVSWSDQVWHNFIFNIVRFNFFFTIIIITLYYIAGLAPWRAMSSWPKIPTSWYTYAFKSKCKMNELLNEIAW